MNRVRILVVTVVALTLLAITTQAFAGPGDPTEARRGTPGAKETARAERQATQRAAHPRGGPNGNQGGPHANQGQAHQPKQHHVGVVTEYLPGVSITILAHNGESYTYLLTPDTRILPGHRAAELAVCRLVTVIFPRNHTDDPTAARGIVVHPDVQPAAFDFTGCPGAGTGTPTGSETPGVTETPTNTPGVTETPTNTPIVTNTATVKPSATPTPTP